jgi:hypothetical protein
MQSFCGLANLTVITGTCVKAGIGKPSNPESVNNINTGNFAFFRDIIMIGLVILQKSSANPQQIQDRIRPDFGLQHIALKE